MVSSGAKLNPRYGRVTGRRGVIVDCNLYAKDTYEIKKWIRERAARKRVRISSSLLNTLLERCGDLMSIEKELEKFKYGWRGRTINSGIIDASVADRGGGIPLVANGIFDGKLDCLSFAAKSRMRGISITEMINSLIREILMRLRLRQMGGNVPRAAQTLRIDQRYASRFARQAELAGLPKLWQMVKELSVINGDFVLAEVKLFRWLGVQTHYFSRCQ